MTGFTLARGRPGPTRAVRGGPADEALNPNRDRATGKAVSETTSGTLAGTFRRTSRMGKRGPVRGRELGAGELSEPSQPPSRPRGEGQPRRAGGHRRPAPGGPGRRNHQGQNLATPLPCRPAGGDSKRWAMFGDWGDGLKTEQPETASGGGFRCFSRHDLAGWVIAEGTERKRFRCSVPRGSASGRSRQRLGLLQGGLSGVSLPPAWPGRSRRAPCRARPCPERRLWP